MSNHKNYNETMLMNLSKLYLPLLGFTLLSPLVAADGQPGNAERERLKAQWQSLDPTGKERVTLAQLPPFLAGAMQMSDLNKDGLISFEEYLAYDRDPGGAALVPLGDNVKLIADIPYTDSSNPRHQLDIYLPQQASVTGPLPVLVYIHGGGWQMGSKVMARTQIMELVNSGRFAAVSVGYRLGWDAAWPAQSDDLQAALRWVRANAQQFALDATRVCAFGASAGAHIAAHLGVNSAGDETDTAVQCVVDFFGPADLTKPLLSDTAPEAGMVSTLLGGSPEQNSELARSASPLFQVKPGTPPFLVIHGTADPLVAYDDSVRLVEALNKVGATVFFQTIEGGGHGNFGAAKSAVDQRVEAFLNRVLYNDQSVELNTGTLKAAAED